MQHMRPIRSHCTGGRYDRIIYRNGTWQNAEEGHVTYGRKGDIVHLITINLSPLMSPTPDFTLPGRMFFQRHIRGFPNSTKFQSCIKRKLENVDLDQRHDWGNNPVAYLVPAARGARST